MFMSLKHCVHSFLCVCRVFASHPIVYDDSVTLNFGLSAVFVGVVNGSIWKWSKMGTKLLFSGKVGLPLGHTFEIYHWWNKVIGKVKTVSFGLYFLKTHEYYILFVFLAIQSLLGGWDARTDAFVLGGCDAGTGATAQVCQAGMCVKTMCLVPTAPAWTI